MKRRNLLRIHKNRHERINTDPITASFAMSEPAADHAKNYLATLQDEEAPKDTLCHSLAFDLTLSEWKSHAELTQSVPIQAHHRRKEMLLYAQEEESIPVFQMESSSPITQAGSLAPPPTLPFIACTGQTNMSKQRKKKPFFNFQTTATGKLKFGKQTQKKEKEDRQYLKPALFTLSQELCPPKQNGLRQIKLNFPTPKRRREDESSTIQRVSLWPFHGIHQHRNKFQLILTRKKHTTKMIRINMKQDPSITVFTRKLE